MLLNEAPNPEWSSFAWRQYMWQQVFTGGRGCTWIERAGAKAVALWPMDPTRTSVRRQSGRKIYRFDNKEYPAADVIDVPFMLKANQLDAYGPIAKGKKAIGLAIAMNDFAGTFFAGGGVPPLALEGPLPQGRTRSSAPRPTSSARSTSRRRRGRRSSACRRGTQLKAIGIDPDKGQMTEAGCSRSRRSRGFGAFRRLPAGSQQRDLLQHRAAGSAAREAPDRALGQGSSRTSST
jgi:phage portal protein BeeE